MSPSMLENGIYPGVSRDRYDSIERVNLSTLKWMKRSAFHYRHHLITPGEDTDPKRLGRAVHLAVFEPERFARGVAKWDGGSRRGKDWDQFVKDNEGREILTEAQYEKCGAIQKAVRNDTIAKRYVEKGRGEVTMLWNAPVPESKTGETIACKGRIDFDQAETRVDLKTTFDASPDAFGRQAFSLGYHTQDAWYGDGYVNAGGAAKPGVIIAAESVEPYAVQVYFVSEHLVDLGRATYREWLTRLSIARASSDWPPYSAPNELVLEFPHWAFADRDEDLGSLGLKVGGVGIGDVQSPLEDF